MYMFATMNFVDIFKSDFLENIMSVSITDAVLAMIIAIIIGFFIQYVYQKTFRGVMYSASFGTSLIAMCVITTFVILAVTSNVVLSLGMVGALSIVRFRTAVKEPIEISYLFWSIGAGIVIGAGMFPLAVAGSIIIGVILVSNTNKKVKENPYILVINCETDKAENQVMEYVNKKIKRATIKSKSVSATGIEVTLEMRLVDNTSEFVNEICKMEQVSNAVLVSYNGEYMA